MRFIRLPVLVTVLSIATAVSVAAQPAPQGAFVELRLGQDRDDTRPAYEIAGPTRRLGVSAGIDWGRSGIELDVTVPEWHTKFSASTSVFTGPSGVLQKQGHVYESIYSERRRSIDVSVLYRLNLPLHRRVVCTWLLGAGQVYRPAYESPTLNEVLPDGTRQNIYTRPRTSSRDYLVGITRLDTDVRIAGHLWLGPRFSLTMYPSLFDESGSAPRGFVGRAELAVRWRF